MDLIEEPCGVPADDMGELKLYQTLKIEHNRKNKKSGGFQAMGLSPAVFKGVMKKGYSIPTPIQRKSIPVIMDGRDVVAMARTGSGKTAAFVIPLLDKLKAHSSGQSPRALILSPTRELALQTYTFVRDLARFTNLTTTIILGGDRMEDQFEAIHQKPDVVVATPGRLLHVLVEMSMKLSFIEYCVFDEADRLFEMGFEEQLKEIISRMPASRQTLMFSATLPKSIVEFAKGGLTDPTLIRLDVDNKLNDGLKLLYLSCREVDKSAVLLHLLRTFLNPGEQTVVFTATKHHVEYLKDLLNASGIPSTCIYSALDPAARKINLEKFRRKRCNVMIVTDIAARGVDIPDLDNVINYHFPPKGKLFLHRVGRVARAGRTGQAYSLISPDELPYLLDLHLFLGRPVQLSTDQTSLTADGIYGAFPQSFIDEESDLIRALHDKVDELSTLTTVCDNAYKKYLQTRPVPSLESINRVKKKYRSAKVALHPLFRNEKSIVEVVRMNILEDIRGYKPQSTIFELGGNKKSDAFSAMKAKRSLHQRTIVKQQQKELNNGDSEPVTASQSGNCDDLQESTLGNVFKSVLTSKPFGKLFAVRKKPKSQPFIPYMPVNHHSEKGLELEKSFHQEAQNAMLDVHTDEADQMLKNKRQTKWDRKRKKFVAEDDSDARKKKIRTESGALIPASYKTDFYDQWRKMHQIDFRSNGDDSDNEALTRPKNLHDVNKTLGMGRMKYQKTQMQNKQMSSDKRKFKPGKVFRTELKSKDEIAKDREKRSSQMAHQKRRREINEKNRTANKEKIKKKQ